MAVQALPTDGGFSGILGDQPGIPGVDVPATYRSIERVGRQSIEGLAILVFVCSVLFQWGGGHRKLEKGAWDLVSLLIGGVAVLGVGVLVAAPGLGDRGLLGVIISWSVVACLTLALADVLPPEDDGPDAMAPRHGARRQGFYFSMAAILVVPATSSMVPLATLGLLGVFRPNDPVSIPLVFAVRCGQFLLAGAVASALARRAKVIHAVVAGGFIAAFLAADTLISPIAGAPGSRLNAALLFLPLAIQGGAIEIVLTKVSRRLTPRQVGTYRTKAGQRIQVYPPWRDLTLAGVWFALALVALGTCWIPATLASRVKPLPIFALVMATATCFTSAAVLYVLGRRRSAPSAIERLRRDPRPPVVYLRSFRDDGRRVEEGVLPELAKAFWRAVGWTVEQRLVAILGRVGPVVAIGRPGEELPEEGAARMYVADAEWPDLVLDLLDKACLVVLQVGDSAGIRWEIEKVGERMRPERVLLFVPFDSRRDRREARRDRYYRRTRAAIDGCLPTDLPMSIRESSLIYFTATQTGLPGARWIPHLLAPDQLAPLDHPFGAPLERLAASRAFRRPRNVRGLTVVLLWLLAAIIGVFITVFFIAIFLRPGHRGWQAYAVLAVLGTIEACLVRFALAATSGELD
jgi:hypothetical protein